MMKTRMAVRSLFLGALLALLLMPLGANAELSVTLSSSRMIPGDLLEVTAEGGARYEYTLLLNGEVYSRGVPVPFDKVYFRPHISGSYVLRVTSDGGEEQEATFRVLDMAELPDEDEAALFAYTVSANGLSARATAHDRFMMQGGYGELGVRSPGVWQAETDADFVELITDCGMSGDTLRFKVLAGSDQRQGVIVLHSGGMTAQVQVSRAEADGLDEEVSLFPTGWVLVNGEANAVWQDAEGSRAFTVSADGAWEYRIEGDFMDAMVSGGQLTLSVEANEGAAARYGQVTIERGTAQAHILVQQAPAPVRQPSLGHAALLEAWEAGGIFSQKDGWWLGKRYSVSNLDVSGCAIFTLSHALARMGVTDPEARPERLARTFAACLVDGGTLNQSLIERAAHVFGYTTREELIGDAGKIVSGFASGDLYSFSVAKGHIALAAGMGPDGKKVLIIDSAPSATLERIQDAAMYYMDGEGKYVRIRALSQIPGIRYYFETDSFSGAAYYLDLEYVAKRGVRLIRPPKR